MPTSVARPPDISDPPESSPPAPSDVPPQAERLLGSFGPKLLLGVLLTVVVFAGLAIVGDLAQVGAAFRRFSWWLVFPVLGLTVVNFALRFWKWQLYLERLGANRLSLSENAGIFLAGMSLSITPGRVGELIKAVLLRRMAGVPVSRGTALIAVERLTDGIGGLLLAGIGATQFSYGRTPVLIVMALAVAGGVILSQPRWSRPLLAVLARFPLGRRLAAPVESFIAASGVLLRPRLLAGSVVLATLAWGVQCVAFALVLWGLGIPASLDLLLVATFVLVVSSLAGAVSMLPAGLGVTDASSAAMLILLVNDPGMNRGVAAAATLISRVSTLWFSVGVGVVAILWLQRRVTRGQRIEDRG